MGKSVRGIFVSGTDTGVGKTFVATLIVKSLVERGLCVGVYKPVASGCERDHGELTADDATQLATAAECLDQLEHVCPQRFAAPLAPHLAARREGRSVDGELLLTGLDYWLERSDVVVVEGVGGLMSPVTEELYVADIADQMGFPVVVVAANVLGAINQTLQTLITAHTFRDGLPVAGVVLNDVADDGGDLSRQSNRAELARRCVPAVLDHVVWQAERLSPDVDWLAIAGRRRA